MPFDYSKLANSRFLEQRLEKATKEARRLASGDIQSEDDLDIQMRCALADHYGLPIFDPYFDRPIHELAFELALIVERKKKSSTQAEDVVKENLEEAAEFASEGWDAVSSPLSDEEKERMKAFMSTGEFK